MAVSVDPLVGRTLGDFVLRERFAAGGGGDVYLADQVTLGRQVVVKVVHQLGDAPQRFLREARLASRLDHPFVAHVYGFGAEDDGTLWMAMELVRGTPLDVLIMQQGAIPLPRFVPLFERLCEVLHAAHEQGIVHRDIKPHNIMVLNRAGRLTPKLLDLGISRRIGKDVEPAAPLVPPRPLAQPDDGWERTVTLPRGGDATAVVAPASVVAPPPSATSQTSRTARRLAESETFELTQAGQVMGTPHYIAPEQWRGNAQADPRADLYSLAIVAYEALTGRLPYAEVRTIDELIEAQQKRPLPPLPDGLPLPLQEVLARGASRDPDERYPTALALGAAVREACGLGVEADELPGLPHDLLDNFTREAPQPIAEAIARIEAARTERQQHEAIAHASRVIVRWLALVALACHARVAPTTESEATQRGIRKLADDALDDAEWAALAAALVAPYRERAAAFPLPELVAACGLPYVAQHTLTSFAAWLRQLLFLLDYALVIDGERWMGTRRADRLAQRTVDAVAPDELRLVDAVGCTVVVLSPLLQRFAPSGGMAQEVFFFEGRGRHGARLVAHPASFELQSDAPLDWLIAQRFAIAASESTVEREATPYKGLETFGPADADNYFGREREAESFANRLRQSSFLAVVGPSGTGKSSFVLAGVLPLLPRDTEVIVMRPGATPRLPVIATDARSRLLVVDQFEELITLCPDPATREAFAAELCAIATGNTRVVITLRDDFLLKVQQLAAMRERLSRSLQLLGTPARDDLLRVLTEPARRVGFGFDDPELPAKMVDTVIDRPGALALLSFAASQLWELRDRAMRHMRAKTYEAIGGVGGALGQHAESTLAAMSDSERALVREAFRHLVTAERTRAVLTRAELTELLGADASGVIEKLVVARILVTSADAHDRVEIIHEALIESWPRLAGWMREDAENARLRDSLRASARQWQERGRPKGLLWRAETLTEYKVWRARYPGRLTQSEEAFAAASLRDELRGKRIRQGLAATAFAGLSVALVLIFGAYREAKQRFLALRQEQARLALIDVQPLKALAYLEDAVKNGADNRSLRRMAGFIDYQLAGSRGIAARHANAVWKTAMSHDGTRWASITDDVNTTLSDGRVIATKVVCNEGIFTARDRRLVMGCLDGTALPIDPVTGSLDAPIALGEQPVWDVTARRDDDLVLISQPRVGVRQVNVRTGAITDVWRDPEAPPVRTDVDRDDRHVAIFSGSGTIDVKSQKGLLLLPDDVRLFADVVVHDAEFSRDGTRLVMGTADGQVGVYDVAKKTMLWKKALRPDKIISHAEFSPDGTMVLANDAETTLYEAATGAVRWSVPPGGGSLCWAPDSQRIFTGGGSGVLEARDVATGDIVWRHHGHGNVLTHCRVTPDGNTVITSSESGTVRLWDAWQRIDRLVPAPTIGKMRNLPSSSAANGSAVITAKGLYAIDAEQKPRALVEEPVADNAVVTVDTADNGSIAFSIERRLRIHDGKQIVSDVTLPGPIIFMAYNQGGSRVASFLLSAGATFVTSREGVELQKLVADDHVDVSSLLFVDDHTLAVCNLNGDLRLWDVETGKQLAKVKAHGGQCSLERELEGSGQGFRTLAEDRGVAWWRWADGKLVERDRQILARAPRAFAMGADAVALTATGHLALFDERGLLLGELRTRAGELPAATTRGDRFQYWDRAGNFAAMTPPGITSPAVLQTLDRCRGLWDLKADHLTERASEPSCS